MSNCTERDFGRKSSCILDLPLVVCLAIVDVEFRSVRSVPTLMAVNLIMCYSKAWLCCSMLLHFGVLFLVGYESVSVPKWNCPYCVTYLLFLFCFIFILLFKNIVLLECCPYSAILMSIVLHCSQIAPDMMKRVKGRSYMHLFCDMC